MTLQRAPEAFALQLLDWLLVFFLLGIGLRFRHEFLVADEAVEAWEAERRTSRGGQPAYSDLAILTALTFKAVFRLAYRQTEGLIGSVIGLLGLDLAAPDPTPLCRGAETLEVPRPKPRGAGAGDAAGGGGAEP